MLSLTPLPPLLIIDCHWHCHYAFAIAIIIDYCH
jgi:hypothetical protein